MAEDRISKALRGKGGDEQIGTPHGHYAPPAEGPFQCMRCIHFKQIEAEPTGMCDHPEVIKDAKAGHLLLREGKAVVHHEGCSDYFNPGPLKATSIAHQ